MQLLWIFLFVASSQFGGSHGSAEEKLLLDMLLTGYNRLLRPVLQPDEPVEVTLQVSLVEVMGLDEDSGRVAMKLLLHMDWMDDYLTWDPNQFGGVTKIFLPTNEIWTPDITLRNGLQNDLDRSLKLDVTSDGHVRWNAPTVISITCHHQFRTNSWVCPIRYGSWVYDGYHLNIVPPEGQRVDVDVSSLVPTDHWSVLEHKGQREVKKSKCCHEPYVIMDYVLNLRRKMGPSLLGRRRRK